MIQNRFGADQSSVDQIAVDSSLDNPLSDDSREGDRLSNHPVLAEGMLQGLHLLEADAGTGKTWTLTGLVVRAVIERGLSIDSILAVTFTKAAVAELKSRTRARLGELVRALTDQPSQQHKTPAREDSLDPFVKAYRQRLEHGQVFDAQGDPVSVDKAARQLQLALARSDELAAFTLHGFCQRLLSAQPLLTRAPPDLSPQTDTRTPITVAVRQWWQTQVLPLPLPQARLLLSIGVSPKDLVKVLEHRLGDPTTAIAGRRVAWREGLQRVSALLPRFAAIVDAEYERVLQIFTEGKKGRAAIDGTRSQPRSTRKHIASLREFCRIDRVNEWPREALFYFCTERLSDLKANFDVLGKLAWFSACDELIDAFDHWLNPLLRSMSDDCLAQVRSQLDQQQFSNGELSYNDLVRIAYEALSDRGSGLKSMQGSHIGNGARLAAALRQRYPFALVDECQDTDPLQWAILRSIWPMTPGSDCGLVLVGDPKQSIYRFRGADIYAYLEARDHWSGAGAVQPKLARLDENQRSDPGVLAGINEIFRPAKSFLISQIQYAPARPGAKLRAQFCDESFGKSAEASRGAFNWVQWTASGKPNAQRIAAACAHEIKFLLDNSKLSLDGKRLEPHDIAVLVATHAEARQVKLELLALGLGAVEITREQVMDSEEAHEVMRIVAAVANPGNMNLLRGALATRALGVPMHKLNEQLVEHALLFEQARRAWPVHGPHAALARLFRTFDTPAQLADSKHAERSLTNHTHVLELIASATQAHAGASQALRWLQRVISGQQRPESQAEELELRLESDANLIRILTVHRSKGLEFPVVFVPFAWKPPVSRSTDRVLRFHELQSAQWEAQVDLNLNHSADALAQRQAEDLAERLRLLYVGLTRAKHRCYLFGPAPTAASAGAGPAPATTNAPSSSIDYLLALAAAEPSSRNLGAFKIIAVDDLLNESLASLAQTGAQAAAATEMIAQAQPRLARATRRLTRLWLTSSYSALLNWEAGSGELSSQLAQAGHSARDRDQMVDTLADVIMDFDDDDRSAVERDVSGSLDSAANAIRFAFPAGANAGACLHRILEVADFARGVRAASLVNTLAAYGLGDQDPQALAEWLNQVLQAPLNERGLRLADIDSQNRLVELEFKLKVDEVSNAALIEAIAQTEPLALQLPARTWRGFLNGFVDLVFRDGERYYLLDWKSNKLGNSVAAYSEAALRESVREHSYALQYSIYQVALHRYLKLRLRNYDPARHLGGVYYLFLRGVGLPGLSALERARGVYFRPANLTLLAQLDQILNARFEQ